MLRSSLESLWDNSVKVCIVFTRHDGYKYLASVAQELKSVFLTSESLDVLKFIVVATWHNFNDDSNDK